LRSEGMKIKKPKGLRQQTWLSFAKAPIQGTRGTK